jgi:hypothetical protein
MSLDRTSCDQAVPCRNLLPPEIEGLKRLAGARSMNGTPDEGISNGSAGFEPRTDLELRFPFASGRLQQPHESWFLAGLAAMKREGKR